jgi:hypothetical protein
MSNNVRQKLNRSQQRAKDRMEQEAKDKFNLIAEKFLKEFTEADLPLSVKMDDRRKQLDSQWRIYCNRMNLVPDAYVLFLNYSQKIIDEYKEKTKKEEAVEVKKKPWYKFW